MVLDFLTGEFIDVIEWVDDTRDTMVWRYETRGRAIKYGAKLTVREGQAAVFVHEGQLADVFGPGLYMLETNNMPVLTRLQHWDHGFRSPFKSEIYFVNTTRFNDLKWGTRNPVIARDPEFGPVRLRAFGTYSMRVTDPAAWDGVARAALQSLQSRMVDVHEEDGQLVETPMTDYLAVVTPTPPAGQVPHQPRVGVAEQQVTGLGLLAGTLDVVQDPLDLGAGEVARQGQPGEVPEALLTAVLGQLVHDLLGAGVLPHDRVVDGLSGVLVPHHGGLALVGDAHGGEVLAGQLGLGERVRHAAAGVAPDLLGIVLHPARTGEDLLVLELAHGYLIAIVVEDDAAG